MIKIIAVGKMKKFQSEVNNYLKQLSHNVQVIEVKDESLEENIVKEEKAIFKNLKEDSYVILLDIKGELLDSIEFSKKLDYLITTYKEVVFIIGGSFGVTEAIKHRANERISFSPLTFPHQLMRLIFVEQLYRAFKIKLNHPYHKWSLWRLNICFGILMGQF